MDLDLTRLPTGTTGWQALIDHAKSLGDLSEVDWLELKGTLPFSPKGERKRSAVILARAILGMANRDPEDAAKHLAAYGVVLVGIAGNVVTGSEQIDGAQLHDALDPYVGQDGLTWDYSFINHADGLVLALTVDPPQWGDPVFTFQKEFSDGDVAIRDGETFVRVPGKTRPATSQDMRNLQKRLTASPSSGADVAVQYVGKFDRIETSSAHRLVERVIEETADSLAATAPAPPAASPYGFKVPAYVLAAQGMRSSKQYLSGIEDWRQEALEQVGYVASELLRRELARGKLRIVNSSDRYLENVRAQVQFPPGVKVLIGSDTDYCDHGGPFNFLSLLPDAPPMWDRFNSSLGHLSSMVLARPRAAPISGVSDFSLSEQDGGYVLTWDVGDLRPTDTEVSDEVVAVVSDAHGLDVMPVRWRATARGVDHVFKGTSQIDCEQEKLAHLRWSFRDDDLSLGSDHH